METNEKEDSYFNPSKNPDMISIWKDIDGNYRGKTVKFGVEIEVREAKPEDCLTKLLTHDGKAN